MSTELRELCAELSPLIITTSKGDTHVTGLKRMRNGDLRLLLANGVSTRVPHLLRQLNTPALRVVVQAARTLKKRGLIGSTITFFKLLSFLILLLLLGVIILVFATARSLLR